jgi:membrane-associated protease RseP (regulator of RpoE activity)
MTDETPQAEGEPTPAAPDATPTAETKPITYDDAVKTTGDEDDVAPAAADAEPTQATPVAAATAPQDGTPTADAPAQRPPGIFVPKWVGLVAAAIIAALVFGGIGYAIGDSSSDSGSTQNASNFPGTANGNGQLPNGGPFSQGQLPNGNGNGTGTGNGGTGNSGGTGNGGGTTASNAGFLGVGVETADNGVQITDVATGSPAAGAGLQSGDVVTAIDGTNVKTAAALSSAIQAKSSGDQISVTYTRDGKSNTVKVTLSSRAQAQSN